jgi:hypothetical protein
MTWRPCLWASPAAPAGRCGPSSTQRSTNDSARATSAAADAPRLYTVGLGSFADGRPAEVFLNVAKSGTPLETYARDSAILLSLLLQHGCPIATVRHAICRNADGSPAGPIGHLLDLIEGGP